MREIKASLVARLDGYVVSVFFMMFCSLKKNTNNYSPIYFKLRPNYVSFVACSKILDIFELQETQNFIEQIGCLTQSKKKIC